MRPGRPSTSTDVEMADQIDAIIQEHRQVTVMEASEKVGVSVGSVHEDMHKIHGTDVLLLAGYRDSSKTIKSTRESRSANNGSCSSIKTPWTEC